jgi:hypothetical protein
MAGPSHSCHISSPETVNLLEIYEPVSDFSGESADSEPDYTGNQTDSESDNGIGEENSDEASNPTKSFLIIVVPMWLEHYASIRKMCLLK